MESDSENSHFVNDQDIKSKKYDILKRHKFAENVAKSISQWKKRDNLIIGVYGEWGSGKSSVKNMIIECLDNEAQIVDFTPWEWQEQKVIAEELFNQIQIQLCSNNGINKKRIKEIKRNLKKYAIQLRIAKTILSPLRKLTKWASGFLCTIVAVPLLKFVNTFSDGIILGVILTFIGISLIIGLFDFLTKIFNDLVDYYTLEDNKPLQEIKEEVTKSLASLDNPVVVMIDDIDRLNKNETKLLFQIIKVNSDFPNLIYVLFLQRDIVESHLEEGRISGSEYLKKIIQVPFELPKPSPQAIHEVFHDYMEKIIVNNKLPHLIDYYRKEIFSTSFYGYFNNLRDVKRFVNSFQFQLNMLKTDNILEVNFIDLILLEGIRQYEPELYQNIYKYKISFTENLLLSQEMFDENKKFFLDIIKGKNLIEIIRYLFPNLKKYFDRRPTNGSYNGESNLRLYHPDFFDRYFQLQLSEGDISQREIEKIIINSKDTKDLEAQFNILNTNDLLNKLIYRIYQHPLDIKDENLSNLITVLFNFGDSSSRNAGDLTKTYMTVIIDRLLKIEVDKAKKLACILKALKETNGVYLPVYWLSIELDKIKNPSNIKPNFEREDIRSLQKMGLEIIHKACDNGKLELLNDLRLILLMWVEWGDLEGESVWINNLICTKERFLKVLCSISSYDADVTSGLKKYIDPMLVERKVIDLNKLMEHIDLVNELELNSEEKYSIAALRDACHSHNIQTVNA